MGNSGFYQTGDPRVSLLGRISERQLLPKHRLCGRQDCLQTTPLISSPCHSTSTTTVDLLNISKCWKQGENVGFLAQQPFTISVSNRAVGMGAARTGDTHTWVSPAKISQVEWSCTPKHSLETATSKKWSHWWLQKTQKQPKKKRLLDLSCYSVYQ